MLQLLNYWLWARPAQINHCFVLCWPNTLQLLSVDWVGEWGQPPPPLWRPKLFYASSQPAFSSARFCLCNIQKVKPTTTYLVSHIRGPSCLRLLSFEIQSSWPWKLWRMKILRLFNAVDGHCSRFCGGPFYAADPFPRGWHSFLKLAVLEFNKKNNGKLSELRTSNEFPLNQ